MGCTSSTPNMANPSMAEKSIKFEDENSHSHSNYEEEIIYRAADNVNVLPSCDNLPEPIHLDRNKSTSSFKIDKDNSETEHKFESLISKVNSRNSLQHEDKSPKLEKVVEKIVELHHTAEHMRDPQLVDRVVSEPPNPKTEENTNNHNLAENKEEETDQKAVSEGEDKEKEENLEEALSPSQSESSRATRWEALADIAAELPASLTIDPITGQIYSLSK